MEELKEILSPLLPFVRTEHILPTNSDVLSDAVSAFFFFFFIFTFAAVCICGRCHHSIRADLYSACSQLKRGLISTPPLDMLPTAEGGKANSWLRQKNAGIYVRPRLFSPYVEEAKVWLSHLGLSNIIMIKKGVRHCF